MRIEDFIKHGPHCLAGKYSTMGRCSCGAQAALDELVALRKAAQQKDAQDRVEWRCPKCEAMNYGDCWKCGSHQPTPPVI